MIIILKTNGQIVTDDGNPVEITALENAAVILADPKDGDSIVYDATAGVWKAGNPLPVVITDPKNGDVLTYDAESGKWVNTAATAAEPAAEPAAGGEE